MNETTPFGLLISAASDRGVSASGLVRAAQVVALASGDAEMAAWCVAELNGYGEPQADLPGYRQAPVQLMVNDQSGRPQPAIINDEKVSKLMSHCPLSQSLSELEMLIREGPGTSFHMLFKPHFKQKLLKMFPGATDVFRVVQGIAFQCAVEAARQRVFAWSVGHLHDAVTLPAGVSVEGLLGISLTAARPTTTPVEAMMDARPLSLSIHSLSNSSILVNSPHAASTITHFQSGDVEAVRAFVSELRANIDQAKKAGAPPESFAVLASPLDELCDLSELKAPRREWIRVAAASVKAVLEQAAGSILGNLATPRVMGLLTDLLK